MRASVGFQAWPEPGRERADAACPKKVADNSYENVWKKGGKAVATAKGAVSKDGKTLTVSQNGTDAKGAAISSVAVYDRQ